MNPTPASQAQDELQEYHWTADKFYQVPESGVFDDPGRLELIQGRIFEKAPHSPLHTALIGHIAGQLRPVLAGLGTVRTEAAIHIAFDGEPIPDISVVRGTDLDYIAHHAAPADALLLVEIALSSAEYDLGGKAFLYAQAGIRDYWVVLPEAGEIVVHREPTPEGFRSVTRWGLEETIAPLAAADAALPVRELLGARL